MLPLTNFNNLQNLRRFLKTEGFGKIVCILIFLAGILLSLSSNVLAQSPVSGGFQGTVLDKSGAPLSGAIVQFINTANGFQTAKKSDQNGNFRQDTLQPGVYRIVVKLDGYLPFEKNQELYATRTNSLVPVPVQLEKEVISVTNPDIPPPVASPSPFTPSGSASVAQTNVGSDTDSGADLNPRRGSAFNQNEVGTLPLGGTTLTRSFDELALLAPGVAPPPQAIGNSVGPGVGGGVGTSGQFAVNGLRSRANNFTVDGSDNNDEDIGVRRQGFFALVPQPVESIQEFTIITLLAPAQFGRNLGAQVNVNSKSGGNQFHGTIYGIANADFLNARNFFDNASGDKTINLNAIQSFGAEVPVYVDGVQKSVNNDAGEKDTLSLLQGGFAIGGRIVKNKMFFFVSGEGQLLNGSLERNFAVPTVEQRGIFGSGAEGLFANDGTPVFPTSVGGDAVFSLFPFANNPSGVFGRNTYTQALSTDARGRIFSGKYNWNIFKIRGNQQIFTARYNYTDDKRDLTDVGGALFSAIRPLVRTDNFSTYLTGGLSNNVSNELRFSFGRTRLRFEELRDTNFLLPIDSSLITNPNDRRFLLNARQIENDTLSGITLQGCVQGTVCYSTLDMTTAQSSLGPIGQLIVAGYSPVGVDVFNFPQERKNNTYQVADTLRWQIKKHSFSFGTDIRRTYLDSNLPRNSRPLVTFNGGVDFSGLSSNGLASPLDFAASGGATGFFQSLILPGKDAQINLSYYQFNFFAQDEWRLARNFSLNVGLRYEYNTPPKEADRKIEDTFNTPRSQFPDPQASSGIDIYQGFQDFIAGRTNIYEPDKNNLAPRIGIAWSPNAKTVIRGGYGINYDQILGAVVSQSRNVFPTFSTINTGGGELSCNTDNSGLRSFFSFLNPISGTYSTTSCDSMGRFHLVQPGTLNTLNPAFDRIDVLTGLLFEFPFENGTSFGATIPKRNLQTPMSHQYSVGVEEKLFRNTFLSIAYVGTLGRKLLRFTTPNLGSNFVAVISDIVSVSNQPRIIGTTFDPVRRNQNIGPINQFETTGHSRYDSLQLELRGRLNRRFQYQMSYVYGKVKDNVSDVFDLAGASALPQNSITEAGEYAPANFDVRHRFTYSFIYGLPEFKNRNGALRVLLGDWQIAGTGKFNTGQPFTVNSIYDVNLDGNLTDRLDNMQFITINDDRLQPLTRTCNLNLGNCQTALAAFGADGSVPRNSFRAGSILDLDLSFIKSFALREGQNLQFRADVFNFINRANFGIPVRFLEAPGFGKAVDTVTPGRRIQFAVKYLF